MFIINIAKKITNQIRLYTTYAGIGHTDSGLHIGPKVNLGNRKNIYIDKDVYIKDYCRILAGKKSASIKIGSRSVIHEFCILRTFGGFIHLGKDCSLNPYCVVLGSGGVKIGNYVRIAPHTTIIAQQHKFDRSDIPIFSQGARGQGIVIKDDVWIGANSTLLDGITIGSGAIIGAGAVVTKNVESNSIVGGVPARLIRMRSKL